MLGEIGILSVGAGDTKLSFDKKKPEEVKRARAAVMDMLKKGFAILVEVGTRKGEPIFQRAHAFDPKTDEYIIVGVPEDTELMTEAAEPEKTSKRGRPSGSKNKESRIPANKTRTVAVARSAGG